MKEERLKELLEKYYNGDTSTEEESELKKYFAGNTIVPGYEAEMEMFRHFSVYEQDAAPSDDLESRIIDSIDALESKQKHTLRHRKSLVVLSAAATFLILIGAYFFLTRETEPEDTFDDPQIAYAEAKRILYDVSVRLNRGTLALEQVARTTKTGIESVEKTANMITGQIEIVEHLGRFIETNDQKK